MLRIISRLNLCPLDFRFGEHRDDELLVPVFSLPAPVKQLTQPEWQQAQLLQLPCYGSVHKTHRQTKQAHHDSEGQAALRQLKQHKDTQQNRLPCHQSNTYRN